MRKLLVIKALCVLAIFNISSVTRAQAVRTVALSEDQAPGMPAGKKFGDLAYSIPDHPVINDIGQTAIIARQTASSFHGLWSEGSGSLKLVARSGLPAIGTPNGVNYGAYFLRPLLNSSGKVVFLANLTGGGINNTNDAGIWYEDAGTLALIAREGDHAFGTASGVSYGDLGTPLLNSAGHIAFGSTLVGEGINSTNNYGIWSEGSGSLELIARTGNHAPHTPSGVTFREFIRPSLTLNSIGQMAFLAGLAGATVNSSNDQGIWLGGSSSLTLLVREGDFVPGTPIGTYLSSLNSPAINSASQVAFSGTYSGSEFGSGIWSTTSDSLRLVARYGTPAPGMPNGVVFSLSFSDPVLNLSGQTAFSAVLSGPGINSSNAYSIWSEGSGTLALVARTGDHAPGTPAGVTFKWIFENPQLNSAGKVAFITELTGSGVNLTNDVGIWAEDATGSLQLIAREGDQLEVAPGDFRTIQYLNFYENFSNNSDDHPSGFNDLGQLVFSAYFTDRTSGVFVSNLVAYLPVPGDFDGDGNVDGRDFLAWQRGISPAPFSSGDLSDWQSVYGNPLSAVTSVPESSSVFLALFVFCAGLISRCRL